MKQLYEFDSQDYGDIINRSTRFAVRAIIIKNNAIAMAYSEKEGYYKFPGGGIEKGESHLQALIRETLEETGLAIIPDSVSEFGSIHEIRKSTLYKDEIFDHTSYYYFADVMETVSNQQLEAYEKALDFRLRFVDLRQAYETNLEKAKYYESTFLMRETKALELLLETCSATQ